MNKLLVLRKLSDQNNITLQKAKINIIIVILPISTNKFSVELIGKDFFGVEKYSIIDTYTFQEAYQSIIAITQALLFGQSVNL